MDIFRRINIKQLIKLYGNSQKCSYFTQINNGNRNFSSISITDDSEYAENVKDTILKASLPFVFNYGWSMKSIETGAKTIGYPSAVNDLFIRREVELIHYFYQDCNKKIVDIMKKGEIITDTPMLYLHLAIKKRLEMILPYLATWRDALNIMHKHAHIPMTQACVLTLVDDICYYAGDQFTEVSGYYIRRLGLAVIYRATELKMMEDISMNHERTWIYLTNRLADAIHVEPGLSRHLGKFLDDKLAELFQTGRDIANCTWN